MKVRILLSIPQELLEKVENNVKARPDSRDAKLVKCIEAGYRQLTIVHSKTTPYAEVDGANPHSTT